MAQEPGIVGGVGGIGLGSSRPRVGTHLLREGRDEPGHDERRLDRRSSWSRNDGGGWMVTLPRGKRGRIAVVAAGGVTPVVVVEESRA